MTRRIYAVLLAVTLLAIGLLIYDNDAFGLLRIRQRPQAPPQLTVSPWKDRLQLRWDPAAEIMRQASGAEVLITDGASRKRVVLDGAALHNGNIVYAPHSGDVGFELRTFGPRPEIASVRFLGAVTPGAEVEQAQAPQKPEPFGDAPLETTGAADRAIAPARLAPPPAAEPPAPVHRGVLTRVKHGLAKLWPVHHNSDGGQP